MKTIQTSKRLLRTVVAAAWVGAALIHGSALMAQSNSRPPERMTYQGYLVGADGVALGVAAPKNYDVIFRIYDSESGTTPLWGEQQTVTVDKGYFSVLLGEGAAVSGVPNAGIALSSLFASATASDRYVGFTVKGIGTGGADVDVLPRGRLLSTPYAFLASRAVKLIQDNASGADLLTSSGSKLILSGGLGVTGANTIEFGYGVSGKTDASAGTIGYGTYTTGTLDIVGAGNFSLGNRKIKLWSEGGVTITGDVSLPNATLSGVLNAAGMRVPGAGTLEFGYGVAGKDSYAGMIGYQPFNPGYLEIIGAGNGTRKIMMHASGGTYLTGPIGVGTPATTASVTLPSTEGEKIVLWGSDTAANYGLGIASGTMQLHVDNANASFAFGYGKSGSMTANTRIWGAGWAGINTGAASPAAPLEVKGWSLRNGSYISIKSEWYVEAYGYWSTSDERIKDVIRRSDPEADLRAVEALQVTDYRYRGTAHEKTSRGLLAQEVRKVLPGAVNMAPGFIPDLCAIPKKLSRDASAKSVMLTLETEHLLKTGDRVRLTETGTSGRSVDLTVRQVPDSRTFVVDDEQVPDAVMVYGREVQDFHTVDYNQVFATGISAIQGLAKRVREIEAREARAEELERRAARVESLEKDVAELRKLVVRLTENGKGARQASTGPESMESENAVQRTSVRSASGVAVSR